MQVDFIDTQLPLRKKDDLLKRLQKGEDFLQVASNSLMIPTAKTTKGDIGYITCLLFLMNLKLLFTLLLLENIQLRVSSKIGYHIFKNLGERKAVGKIKAQQILLAIPPGADDAAKKKIAALADSLYQTNNGR